MKKHCQNTQRQSTVRGQHYYTFTSWTRKPLAEQKVTNNYYTTQFQASLMPEKFLLKKKKCNRDSTNIITIPVQRENSLRQNHTKVFRVSVNSFWSVYYRLRHFCHYYLLFKPLTYLLTPRSRVLLEKLTGSAASQEIPRILGTRRFITVHTNARHLSLS